MGLISAQIHHHKHIRHGIAIKDHASTMKRSFGTTLAYKPNDRRTIVSREKYQKNSTLANKLIAFRNTETLLERMYWGGTKIVIVAFVFANCCAPPSVGRGIMLNTKQIRREGQHVRIYVLCSGDDCPAPTPKTPVSRAAPNTATPAKGNATGPQASPPGRAVGGAAAPIWTAHFALGSATVNEQDRALLHTCIGAIGGNKVVVSGYTDAVGGRKANERLSLSRAQVVGAMLEALGIPSKDIALRAYPNCCGTERGLPLDEVLSPADRKVELTIHFRQRDTS